MNGASSDSRVFVKLYGQKGDTNKLTLAVSDNDLRNYFETGRTDIFTIETSDIGQVSDGVRLRFFPLLVTSWFVLAARRSAVF